MGWSSADRSEEARAAAEARGGEGWQLSFAYFLFFLTLGLFVPYFAPYLRERGLAPSTIGWAMALGPLMKIVFPPLLGVLADRTRGPRFWGMVAAWGAVLGLLLVWVADAPVVLALGLAVYFVGTAPAITLLDASLLQYMQRAGGRFGTVRMWGSAGFIVTSLGLGLLFPSLPALAIIASLVAGHAAFALFVSAARFADAPPTRPDWRALGPALRTPSLLLLLVALFLNRVSSAPFNVFYTIFARESGHDGTVVAATWAVAVATEVLAMTVIDRGIDRFGFAPVLGAGVLLEALRWFGYGMFSSQTALLLLAPWHGIAFTLHYVATVRGLTQIVPVQWRSAGQGLGAAVSGVGQVVGFVAAGYAQQALGHQPMFLGAGWVGVASFVTVLLVGYSRKWDPR